MIELKADPNVECFSTQQDGNAGGLASGIRSCSILNAILRKNTVLLQCVLEAGHSDQCVSACRVCEAGSAYRRISAASLSFFQADALDILVSHVRAHKGQQVLQLENIEVWAGRELLPLHKVPFHSVAVAAMDLPESFFRALFYGIDHLNSLRRTVEFLMDAGEDVAHLSYGMLHAVVDKNSIDGVRLLLVNGGPRHLPQSWWLKQKKMKNDVGVFDLPIMKPIRNGFREIFDIFAKQDISLFTQLYNETCSDLDCPFSFSR